MKQEAIWPLTVISFEMDLIADRQFIMFRPTTMNPAAPEAQQVQAGPWYAMKKETTQAVIEHLTLQLRRLEELAGQAHQKH